jgi:hypothetical protein
MGAISDEKNYNRKITYISQGHIADKWQGWVKPHNSLLSKVQAKTKN